MTAAQAIKDAVSSLPPFPSTRLDLLSLFSLSLSLFHSHFLIFFLLPISSIHFDNNNNTRQHRNTLVVVSIPPSFPPSLPSPRAGWIFVLFSSLPLAGW